ncbi:MAG: DnaJ C-terminal domain-containing protein [Candidatus Paceibacterota bacterium]
MSDDKKKAEYDAYGHAFSGSGGPQGWGGGNPFGGETGVEFDINDIFENFGDMFGGGFGGARQKRGRDISIDIELTFKEAVFGVERKVLLSKNNTCNQCQGSGAKAGTELTTCETCNGNGKVRETRQSIMGSFTTVRACSACNGTGKVPKEKCGHCAGTGVRKEESEIAINIPAGVENGEVIRLTGQGEAIPQGVPGDLYVKLHVHGDQDVKRDGLNLIRTLPVKLTDALLGNTYHVETLDGGVDIKVPAGVKHGETLRIKGKGVPSGNRRGDFLVKITIATPTKLSRKAQKLVEELRDEGV